MKRTDDLSVRLMFKRHLPHVLAIESRNARPWTRQDFLAVFDCPGGEAWVAEIDDVIVGYIVFQSYPEGIHLLNLVVVPYWRRQGIARTMLEKLDEKRPSVIWAIVPERNLPVQMVLREAGYKAVEVLRGQFEEE